MTPAEKAKELVDKFTDEMIESSAYFVNSGAKKCALIAVNELFLATDDFDLDTKEYWQDVKQEIQKL
jgi:hypothetical protein